MHLLLLFLLCSTVVSDDCYSVNGQSFCLCSFTGVYSPDIEHDGEADHCQPLNLPNITTIPDVSSKIMTKISFSISLFLSLVLLMICICSVCVCRDHFCVVVHFTYFIFVLKPVDWIVSKLSFLRREQRRVEVELEEVVVV